MILSEALFRYELNREGFIGCVLKSLAGAVVSVDIGNGRSKLYSAFGIKKLLLEGGSIINGAFLREGLVDGLSIVTAPIIARSGDKPLFEGADMNEFQLLSSQVMENGAVWSMYGV